jgi:hypothetical protein
MKIPVTYNSARYRPDRAAACERGGSGEPPRGPQQNRRAIRRRTAARSAGEPPRDPREKRGAIAGKTFVNKRAYPLK